MMNRYATDTDAHEVGQQNIGDDERTSGSDGHVLYAVRHHRTDRSIAAAVGR